MRIISIKIHISFGDDIYFPSANVHRKLRAISVELMKKRQRRTTLDFDLRYPDPKSIRSKLYVTLQCLVSVSTIVTAIFYQSTKRGADLPWVKLFSGTINQTIKRRAFVNGFPDNLRGFVKFYLKIRFGRIST